MRTLFVSLLSAANGILLVGTYHMYLQGFNPVLTYVAFGGWMLLLLGVVYLLTQEPKLRNRRLQAGILFACLLFASIKVYVDGSASSEGTHVRTYQEP